MSAMSSTLLDLDTYKCDYYGSETVQSSSTSSVASMNTDGNIRMFPNSDSMNSPMSCNMSPMSQTSESGSSSSHTNGFHNLNLASPNDYANVMSSPNVRGSYLSIAEEPVNKFRFRYASEMHGTHGSLTGQTTSRTKKTYPSVQLHNFYGEATIRCSLFQIQKFKHEMATPHSHTLVIRQGNEDRKDPHEVVVSPANDYVAVFQGMGIIHTARKHIEQELLAKLIARAEFRWGRALTPLEMEKLKLKAKKESTDMNLNQVTLCFEAFERRNGEWIEICQPIYSTAINNMKCALTGELKITRLSSVVSSVLGNEDLFLFVEKVGKKNIKVRFYELDEYEQIKWEDWARFSEADVHHQYAIALKTPPYKDINIDRNINVYVQLYRPGDDSYSEPIPFRYKPSDSYANNSRKRPRMASEYSSTDLPASVHRMNSFDYDQEKLKHEGLSISTEYETHKLLQNVLQSAADSTTAHITNDNEQFNSFQSISDNLNSAELVNIFGPMLEDFKLATDSVSTEPRANPVTPTCVAERFFVQVLTKIWPIVGDNAPVHWQEEAKRKVFVRNILKKAIFDGETLLHIALKSDEPRFMEKIWQIIYKFECHDMLGLTNDCGETGLHVAAALEKPNEIKNLLRHGVDVNAIDRKGDTPLHVAVAENRGKSVQALLNECAKPSINLNVANYNGYTPLQLAIKMSNLAFVRMISDKAVPAHAKLFETIESKHGNNGLHIAVDTGASDIVQFILDHRCVDVNATNFSGHTPLVLARAMKHTAIVRILMDHNADGISEEDEDNTSTDSSIESNKVDTRSVLSVPKSFRKMDISSDGSASTCPQRKGEFDSECLKQLSVILNANSKWQRVANRLGYQQYVASWAKKADPSRIMFVFSEAVKLPKEDIIKAFQDLNEATALHCMTEWKQRNE